LAALPSALFERPAVKIVAPEAPNLGAKKGLQCRLASSATILLIGAATAPGDFNAAEASSRWRT
jgi:hypothetical protein